MRPAATPPGRTLRAGAWLLAALLPAAVAFDATATAETLQGTESQKELFDNLQMCASLQLPEDFRRIRDPQHSAASAVALCEREKLALAGQFALDNPGTRQTGTFIEEREARAVAILSAWILASSSRVAPHPLTPPYRKKS